MSTAAATLSPQNTKQIVRALNRCVEVCTDAEKGFRSAAANVRTPELKGLLLKYAQQRSSFVVALQGAIGKLGGFAEDHGTLRGSLRRGWLSYRRLFEGKKDRVTLDACVHGEEASLRTYEAEDRRVFLTVPDDVRALVQQQYVAMTSARADLRDRLALH
jgi:uncharacterized protein (TIGR02284 family)